MGKYELEDLMENVTAFVDMDWDYLCLEADYGVGDIISGYPNKQSLAMLNSHNFALPQIFSISGGSWCVSSLNALLLVPPVPS